MITYSKWWLLKVANAKNIKCAGAILRGVDAVDKIKNMNYLIRKYPSKAKHGQWTTLRYTNKYNMYVKFVHHEQMTYVYLRKQ